MDHPPLVLIADDDEAMRSLLSTSLRRRGFDVTECKDGLELKRALRSDEGARRPSLIVSDLRMPGETGLDILHWVGRWRPDVPMILITAFGDPRTHRRAEALGASAVIDKPFDLDDFHDRVAEALEGQ